MEHGKHRIDGNGVYHWPECRPCGPKLVDTSGYEAYFISVGDQGWIEVHIMKSGNVIIIPVDKQGVHCLR